MRLQVINSNSAGNSYILENDREALLIEVGVNFDRVKKALAFNLTKVVGAIVTHEHKDHCIGVPAALKAGIDVYASHGTHQAMGTLEHHRSKTLVEGREQNIGAFTILPFAIKHDVVQPLGFLINHPETGVVLFLTDSYYSPVKFQGLNNIIVEANYSIRILNEKMSNGYVPDYHMRRVIKSHMSVETCKQLLEANDLSAVNNIVLIHLSDSNGDAPGFQKIIAEATGKKVTVADSGLVIDFNKQPF